jgi:SMC interacting uncharacterized protein involved in chromosome segregation
MPNPRAVESLTSNVDKLRTKLESADLTDEQITELEQSIIDLNANLDRWAAQ